MNPPSSGRPAQPLDQPTAQFSPAELTYLLGERRLGRLATSDAAGQPHVVPVGWSYNPEHGSIDISGHDFAGNRKYRNTQTNPRAAFVVDDVLPPFHPRCVTIQGIAHALTAGQSDGTEAMIRITPTKITSWGLNDSPSPQANLATDIRRQEAPDG